MRVLVIAPHPDDESIGCGGTLCLHTEKGDEVCVLFLSSGERGLPEFAPQAAVKIREDEARQACEVLGISQYEFLRCQDGLLSNDTVRIANFLREKLIQWRPEMLYLPHGEESHPDHKEAHRIVLECAKNLTPPIPVKLRLFEIWTPQGSYSFLQDISSVMPKKIRAIRQHRSQLEKLRYDRGISGLNRYRAAMSKSGTYAEVYQELVLGADTR